MKDILYTIFCSNYFLVFQTKEANYCWRVVNKKFLVPLPRMVDDLVNELEANGKTEIALIKIKKL
jgi:hypothetical protein